MTDYRKARPEMARARAREILTQAGISKAPVPVERLIKKLSIVLRHEALDEDLSGMAYIQDDLSMIGINASHHPNRQRFSAAHELGHHILHKDEITGTVHVDKGATRMLLRDESSSLGVDRLEIEANAFASELLMPKKLLIAEMGGVPIDVEDDRQVDDLAKKFKVSTHAMRLRLLGLLSEQLTS
ncbi:ImmA/IrrE family metallo-endopeptidase [Xanthomonas campestris]|uniref:ImmA/IrrE family metallo-endopeptidase n=1 Tax=Xanthomonas campestris TaxID=339 RepID=UPI002367D5D9|nr:ImmA/IrrE family metallo-endopeptidase [Xanthomonas campestris]MEA9762496.1 ImmA/IrrE family metallo-endopeptidase [Xanthomonas campestris pv. raphani]MEA9814790.1 ImmA/IrrE family metallo-endopeptidase [Xanthomonas campestris pv. raphani]MEA9908056.1 ImmA/IrrE family metallo-endopeptidase [Xanthomonas campestris pv. raphani]MEA9924143.1 ImmA/IrrE family metallo-endopeptidase [Xanthomonas campestris pv. raphani]MEA9936831.1 ImmA/IrrE family metallo-endopeptidase [Xanthomonas campestris pv. 